MSVYWYYSVSCVELCCLIFFFQAEDGIRDLVRSRGLGDVYKRQKLLAAKYRSGIGEYLDGDVAGLRRSDLIRKRVHPVSYTHLTLPTSDLV